MCPSTLNGIGIAQRRQTKLTAGKKFNSYFWQGNCEKKIVSFSTDDLVDFSVLVKW